MTAEEAKEVLAKQEQDSFVEAQKAYYEWVEKYGYSVSPVLRISATKGTELQIEFVKVK